MPIVLKPKDEYEKYDPDCAVLEITLRCNFKCVHCGASAGAGRLDELTLDEVRSIAQDLRRIDFKRVSVIGGEPFIRRDWYDLVNVIKDEGLAITYVSNGSLFPRSPALVDLVVKTRPQVIGFSLDGGTAKTHDHIRGFPGSFDSVWKSIEIMQERGIEVSVITTVNKLNLPELPLLRDQLLGRDINWQVQISSCNGSRFSKEWFITKEDYRVIAEFVHTCAATYTTEELPIAGADDIGYFSRRFPLSSINRDCWNGCKAGIVNLGIQSNGNIKGCNSLPDSYVEGNIRERSLYDIWTDQNSFAYTRRFNKDMLKGACATCSFGERCKGGCVDIAHSISGHAFENAYCLHRQESD